jgi:hypothetical protein
VCISQCEPLSHLLGPWAVDGSFVSYKGIEGGFEEPWISGRDRQRNRGFFSGMIRGVSDPREVSKMLTFLFRPRVVCSSLLHLRSSQKVNSRKFDLAKAAAPCLQFLPYGRLLSGADKLPAPPPASPLLLLPTSSTVWS